MAVTIAYVCFAILTVLAIVGVTMMMVVNLWWMFRYSYTNPWTAPMGVTSDGSSMIFWVIFLTIVSRTAAMCNCVARSANSRSMWVRYLLIVILLVAIGCEIAAVAIFFVEQNGCNNPPVGDPGTTNTRFCNDFRYCCVYGTIGAPPGNSTPVNIDCPLTLTGCTPSVAAADLGWNWVFVTNFAMTWIFMIVWALLLACSIWMRAGLKRKVTSDVYAESTLEGIYDVEMDSGDEDEERGVGASINSRRRVGSQQQQQQQGSARLKLVHKAL
jgi:hypothetical protein